jgi:antitoxin FitA
MPTKLVEDAFAQRLADRITGQLETGPDLTGFALPTHLRAIVFDSIGDVMGQVLVRNLDDRVIESLKTKAELKGRSLEQELREVLTNAAPLTPGEKIALFQKLRAMTQPPLGNVDVRAAIRRGRDDEFDE